VPRPERQPTPGHRCRRSRPLRDERRLPRPSGTPVQGRGALAPSCDSETQTVTTIEENLGLGESLETDVPWLVVVWNDPVNLMTYVTYVLRKLFGYSTEKATKLMLDVHNKGRAVVSSGPRERAENDVSRLHRHGLWATLEKSG
jgi:ATP-dependent Clp protease adaptor protein ClpS